jgi:hypothetical protein
MGVIAGLRVPRDAVELESARGVAAYIPYFGKYDGTKRASVVELRIDDRRHSGGQLAKRDRDPCFGSLIS